MSSHDATLIFERNDLNASVKLTLSMVHVGLSGVGVHGHFDLEQPVHGQLAETENFLDVGWRVAARRLVQRGCHCGGRRTAAAEGAAQRQGQVPAGRRRRQSRRGQSQT